MTEPRSEAQKVTQAPIKVILGGEEFGIELLHIRDAQEWRIKVSAALSQLPGYANAKMEDPEVFKETMNGMLVVMPNAVINLFFSYAKDLDREWVETHANEVELEEAFGKVVDVGFPLSMSLAGTIQRISQ